MAGTDMAGLISRIIGMKPRQSSCSGLRPPIPRTSKPDQSTMQLEMAKEILCEVFGASSSEVEEMIQQRMAYV